MTRRREGVDSMIQQLGPLEGTLLDPEERERFKRERRGLRRDLDARPFLKLTEPADLARRRLVVHSRRSDRSFTQRPLGYRSFSELLAWLAPLEKDGEVKYLYGSAGGAYPVQVYLHVCEERVDGVPAGAYYYHPRGHRLVALSEEPHLPPELHFPTNAAMARSAAFTVFLVADLDAIEPLYGERSRDFSLLEAGLIAQALESQAHRHGVGLCQVGLVHFEAVRERFQLSERHLLLHTLVGGRVEDRGEALPEPEPERTSDRVERLAPLSASVAPARAPSRRVPGSPTRAEATAIQRELVAIWKEVLAIESVDLDENFYDMGGTSLAAVRIVRRVQETYGGVEVADFFAYPTIRTLADFLQSRRDPAEAHENGSVRAVPGPKLEPRPAAPELHAEAVHPPASASSPWARREPIAVVGMAGRFAGAPDLESFWAMLESGTCRVGPVPEERTRLVPSLQPRPDQHYRASYLEDVDRFDPLFFHVSHRDARKMDPSQRLLLEITEEMLERAGYAGRRLSGTRTGLYVGASPSGYWQLLLEELDPSDLDRVINGNMGAILANRISHFLDLRGPSLVLDTACSSSLVAVDLACQALWSGDATGAIVASVNLILSPAGFEAFRQDGMEAAGGLCRAFDGGADGFVRGEGAAAILLKPLSSAERDGDRIVGLLRGSATNHDGATNSLAVPNPVTQAEVIELAHRRAGIGAETIQYVEAHGTGTALGDPIEVSGLTRAFGSATTRKAFCAIGSLKSNLGHLEYTAGLAGLVKTLLALSHRTIPATLHVEAPNPHIDFAGSPFYVADRRRSWPEATGPRRAAVSSFGVGGTNAHVVVEEAPAAPPRATKDDRPAHVLTLSGRTRGSLERLVDAFLDYLGSAEAAALGDVCFTANTGRPHLQHRLAVVCRSTDQLADRLHLARSSSDRRKLRGALIFTGEGAPDGDSKRWLEARHARLSESASTLLAALEAGDPAVPEHPLDEEEWIDLLAVLACRHVSGETVPWEALDAAAGRRRVPLPTSPFERESFWTQRPTGSVSRELTKSETARSSELRVDVRDGAFADHRVSGRAVLPGALYLHAALSHVPDRRRAALSDLRFLRPVELDESQPEIRFRTDWHGSRLSISSRNGGSWAEVAVANVETLGEAPPTTDLSELARRCPEELRVDELYDWFERLGVRYGPRFRTLRALRRGSQEAFAELEAIDEIALLDGALQAIASLAFSRDEGPGVLYLPQGMDQAVAWGPVEGRVFAHARVETSSSARVGRGTVTLLDESGRSLVRLQGVTFHPVDVRRFSAEARAVPENAPRRSNGAPAAPAVREIRHRLVRMLSQALEIPEDQVEMRRPLTEMGVDSTTVVSMLDQLERESGLHLPPTFFFENPTLEKVAQAIAEVAPAELSPPPLAVESESELHPRRNDGDEGRGIAVVGMAGRFPGAPSVDAFWSQLEAGRSAIVEVPRERWDVDRYYDADPNAEGRVYHRWGGFLEGIDRFDPFYFRLSDREARRMDPQQRLLLEVVSELLDTSAYGGAALSGRKVGVYVGASYNHVKDAAVHAGSGVLDAHASLGNHNAILANRVSYFFDLRGPCLTVDTLCSSSLVALDLASKALARGECDFAVVAGVHVGMSSHYFEALSRLKAASPRGRCGAFDRGADGYVPGEGVVALLLRPLAAAVEEGDVLHGVVRGSAVNHGGQAAGLTVPTPRAQAEVIRAALDDAEVDPRTITYVETHGTGTALGDPVEAEALEHVLGGAGRKQRCAIGSVKTGIGHLEPAAGLASVVKVLLSMKAGLLVPTLNFEEPNPRIAFERTSLYVVDRARPWTVTQGPRRAGVSSFGIGGVNSHVVLEEAPPRPRSLHQGRPLHVLTLSARTPDALVAWVGRVNDFLSGTPVALGDLCFSMNAGRAHFRHRVAVLATRLEDVRVELEAWLRRQPGSHTFTGNVASATEGKLAQGLDALSSPARRLLRRIAGGFIEEHDLLPREDPPLDSADELSEGDWTALAPVLAKLYVAGADIDWARLERGTGAQRIQLPPYPYERRSLPSDPAAWSRSERAVTAGPTTGPDPLAGLEPQRVGKSAVFDLTLSAEPER